MPVATRIRMADMLTVVSNELIQEDAAPDVNTMAEKLTMMLYQTENVLSFERLRAVPYEKLSLPQLALLSTKGFASREAYESTPLKGRFYAFGISESTRLASHHRSPGKAHAFAQ
jgi:hypothetical protein